MAQANGNLNGSTGFDSDADQPNLVIHILSVTFRTPQHWTQVTARISTLLDGWVQNSADVLDIQPVRDPNNHQSVTDKGRVYEVRASILCAARRDDITFEACRNLRNKETIRQLEREEHLEIVFQPFHIYRRLATPGLAVFDMDSTLIQQEVIDELARVAGRYEQVAAVTEAAMRGELDFEESLKQRVAQLEGVPVDVFDQLREQVITVTAGAWNLINVLNDLGWKTAVLSGGFVNLAYWLRHHLGLDYAFANQLATTTDGKVLTGELIAGTPIIHAKAKRDKLVELAASNCIPLENTIAVGDGSNDLLMMETAGLGVAFNAKPKVRAAAPVRLNGDSIDDILYLLGCSRAQQMEALKRRYASGGKLN